MLKFYFLKKNLWESKFNVTWYLLPFSLTLSLFFFKLQKKLKGKKLFIVSQAVMSYDF